jgi:hypothetical protein
MSTSQGVVPSAEDLIFGSANVAAPVVSVEAPHSIIPIPEVYNVPQKKTERAKAVPIAKKPLPKRGAAKYRKPAAQQQRRSLRLAAPASNLVASNTTECSSLNRMAELITGSSKNEEAEKEIKEIDVDSPLTKIFKIVGGSAQAQQRAEAVVKILDEEGEVLSSNLFFFTLTYLYYSEP